MRKLYLLLAVLVCAAAANAQSAASKKVKRIVVSEMPAAVLEPSMLPIRRVILYSNGVAYFERRGTVTGNAEINLSFKQSQIDDVLKSMVVLDLGRGKIGAVSYKSSMPASARTAEIPFDIASKSEETEAESGGLAGVLSQLQGAKVLATTTKGTASGSILTVEKRKATTIKKGEEETSLPANFALVIASDAGEISSFDLADIKSVKLLEEGVKHDVNEFANATASTRRRDARDGGELYGGGAYLENDLPRRNGQ
jgi:hypothetical protein